MTVNRYVSFPQFGASENEICGISGSLAGGMSTMGSGVDGGVSGKGVVGGLVGLVGGVGGVFGGAIGIVSHSTEDLIRTLIAVRALSQLFTD